jgi:hypothetical protein
MNPIFKVPYIAGNVFSPGPQPKNPGESVMPWAGHMGMKDVAMPWPGVVGTINALASSAGIARSRAPVPVVNRYGVEPYDYLTIGGFIGKSQG